MSRHYPIYHVVEACHYKASKNYGGKNTSVDTVLVGSSRSNSYRMVENKTLRREYTHPKYGDVVVFKQYVDGIKVKEMIFSKNTQGRADELLHTWYLFDFIDFSHVPEE